LTRALVGLVLVVASFLIAVALCAIVRAIAPRLGLVDTPGGRKAHKAPTPLGAAWRSG
jgi:UDP-N-acetylmuramyl pentapeptide phosphotransferase/UDP-N-acetylglucosamine-1-phosphate transferase